METSRITRLIKKAQEGDKKAFEKLIRVKSKNISYIALSMLKNQHDAEDATQDAIESILGHLKGLQDPEAFEAWMYRIVYRTCLDIQKRGKRQKAIDFEEISKMDILEERSDLLPHESSEKAETSRLLLSKIRELPDNYRNCMYLFYFEEMSYEQIAEALDSSVKDVANWLERGRKKLKAEISYEKIKEQSPGAIESPAIAAAFALDIKETVRDDKLVEESLRKLFAEHAARNTGSLLSPTVEKIALAGAVVFAVGLGGMLLNGLFTLNDGFTPNTVKSTANGETAPTEMVEGNAQERGIASMDNRGAGPVVDVGGNENEGAGDAEPVEVTPPENPMREQGSSTEGDDPAPISTSSSDSTEMFIIENEAQYGSVDMDDRNNPNADKDLDYLTNEVETITNPGIDQSGTAADDEIPGSTDASASASRSPLSQTGDFVFRVLMFFGATASAAALAMIAARRARKRQK